MAAFGGFGGGFVPIAPITDDTAVAKKVASKFASYNFTYGSIDGTFDYLNRNAKQNAKSHTINTTLYRSSIINHDMQKNYRDAALGIVSLSKNLKSMHDALSTVSYMRSNDPNYDTAIQNITSAITIPEIDEWIRVATNVRSTMQLNGSELILRRESYIASTKYRRSFNIDNVSALPDEVKLIICEYIGTDIAITASALLNVRNINIQKFFDITTKSKMLKINDLLQTMVKQVDTSIKTQAILKHLEHLVRHPPQTLDDNHVFVAPALILPMLKFPVNKDVKFTISFKLQLIFDKIISHLYFINADARALLVLNMRKLAVVFKAILKACEKKNKRVYKPKNYWFGFGFDTFQYMYTEPPACQALQNWLSIEPMPESSSENESTIL